MNEQSTIDPTDPTSGVDRRSALKKAAAAGAVVWVAPAILSTTAHAQGEFCTLKCAPGDAQVSFTGSSVRKVGCVDPLAPAGREQYIVEATISVSAAADCPCGGGDATFVGDFVFQFQSPNPGLERFSGTGGSITVSCTDRDGTVVNRTCEFTVSVRITGNCLPQTGIKRVLGVTLTGCTVDCPAV